VKRLGRWSFNLLAGVSLVVCVTTMVLWVRSYWRMDVLRLSDQRSFLQVCDATGRVEFWAARKFPAQSARWSYLQHPAEDLEAVLGPPDSKAGPVEIWEMPPDRIITLRCWALVLLFSLVPAAWLRGTLGAGGDRTSGSAATVDMTSAQRLTGARSAGTRRR
jgi:hypothetical protein